MQKRKPALFFVATVVPYVAGSLVMSGWLAGVDLGAVVFALGAAASLSGLLTLVHEVEYAATAAVTDGTMATATA